MALGFSDDDPNTDDNNNNNNEDNNRPFAWLLVPLVAFVVVATLLTCLRWRRRRKQRTLFGTNALARDLEAMGPRSRPRNPNSRRWPGGGAARRLGLGVGSREEGLNEYGEPPPAYTPAGQKRPDEALALREIETGTTDTASAQAPTASQPGMSGGPPGYDYAQQGGSPTNTQTPAQPPRAFFSR